MATIFEYLRIHNSDRHNSSYLRAIPKLRNTNLDTALWEFDTTRSCNSTVTKKQNIRHNSLNTKNTEKKSSTHPVKILLNKKKTFESINYVMQPQLMNIENYKTFVVKIIKNSIWVSVTWTCMKNNF